MAEWMDAQIAIYRQTYRARNILLIKNDLHMVFNTDC